MISDPEKINLHQFANQFTRSATIENVRSNFEYTIGQYRQFARTAKTPQSVQLRLIDCKPPFSLYIFPKIDGGEGVLYVEMYGYKSYSDPNPKSRITEHDNPTWYKYFTEQFTLIEKDADVINA